MKSAEVHKMNDEELQVERQRLRKQLFELRSQAVTEKLENPRRIGHIRKDVARVLTEIHTRRLQEKS